MRTRCRFQRTLLLAFFCLLAFEPGSLAFRLIKHQNAAETKTQSNLDAIKKAAREKFAKDVDVKMDTLQSDEDEVNEEEEEEEEIIMDSSEEVVLLEVRSKLEELAKKTREYLKMPEIAGKTRKPYAAKVDEKDEFVAKKITPAKVFEKPTVPAAVKSPLTKPAVKSLDVTTTKPVSASPKLEKKALPKPTDKLLPVVLEKLEEKILPTAKKLEEKAPVTITEKLPEIEKSPPTVTKKLDDKLQPPPSISEKLDGKNTPPTNISEKIEERYIPPTSSKLQEKVRSPGLVNLKPSENEPAPQKAEIKEKPAISDDPKIIAPAALPVQTKAAAAPQEKPSHGKTVTKNLIEKKSTSKKPKTNERKIIKQDFLFQLPSFVPNFADVPLSDQCKSEGSHFMNQLADNKIWALKMLDSSAKVPSGVLRGNAYQLGDYDQCLAVAARVKTEMNQKGFRITGKYCLADIDIEPNVPEFKLPVYLMKGRSFIRSKLDDPGHFIPRFSTLRWALCLPSDCTAEDATAILAGSLKAYNETNIKVKVSIRDEECQTRKLNPNVSEYSIGTILTIGIFSVVIVTALLATLRDSQTGENSFENCFSIRRNLKSLVGPIMPKEQLGCIYGLRALSTFLLFCSLKLYSTGNIPFTNRTVFTEAVTNPFTVFLRVPLLYMDTFLVINGFLLAYCMSRDLENRGETLWSGRFLSRAIRVIPMVGVLVLFHAYVLEHLGDGPLWNSIVLPNVRLCQDNFWRNVISIQNFFDAEEMCAPHVYQLAVDMQLMLIVPAIVFFLYLKPVLGVGMALTLNTASLIMRYYVTSENYLSTIMFHGISISQIYRTANLLFNKATLRATPYLMGIGVAVLLRQLKKGYLMPKYISLAGWAAAAYCSGWTLAKALPAGAAQFRYDLSEAAQYAALGSLAWSLAVAWVILYCCTHSKGYLSSFLSSKSFLLLSRISFAVQLTQFPVLIYNTGKLRSPLEFSLSSFFDLAEILTVIAASTALTLLLDLPLKEIGRLAFAAKPQRPPKEVLKLKAALPDEALRLYENHFHED